MTTTYLFHGTSTDPDFIAHHGLLPGTGLSDPGMLGEGVTEAVFLTPDKDEAASYGRDVYRVNADSIDDLAPVDGPHGWHYYTLSPIAPEHLTRI